MIGLASLTFGRLDARTLRGMLHRVLLVVLPELCHGRDVGVRPSPSGLVALSIDRAGWRAEAMALQEPVIKYVRLVGTAAIGEYVAVGIEHLILDHLVDRHSVPVHGHLSPLHDDAPLFLAV